MSVSPPLQEGMLKDLQKSVEEEERVWKARVGAAEEELQKVWLPTYLPRAWCHSMGRPLGCLGPGFFTQILMPDGSSLL